MVEIAIEHECLLGEGPVWDGRTGTLFWVDIINGEIHEYNPGNRAFSTTKLGRMIGAVALCTSGDLLVALKGGLGIIDKKTGKLNLFTDPESRLPNNRFNDGKCDPQGRFWVGTMALDESPKAGSLYLLDHDHHVTKKIKHTTISNGMAWSPDHTLFYYIDTPTLTVVAYDYNEADGEITNKRTVITIAETDGFPDGMTIDSEGMLWIAHWNGWQVTRWNPVTAKKIFTLPMPVANVTSCTFGGPSLNDLYITTAKKGLSEQQLKEQPLAGKLFVWRNTGYKGVAAFEFKSSLF